MCSSDLVGLAAIAELLARIEQAAKQDRLADTPALLSQLATLHAAAADAVRGELERCTASGSGQAAGPLGSMTRGAHDV